MNENIWQVHWLPISMHPTHELRGCDDEFQKSIYFCFIDYAKALDRVDHNKLWKILQEMGIPDHLTCLLRNLHAGQEVTVRTRHGTTYWFQIGLDCNSLHPHPIGMQLYLEGGAWFKKKHPWKK